MVKDTLRLVSGDPFSVQFDETWGEMLEVVTDAILARPAIALELLLRREDYLLGDGSDAESEMGAEDYRIEWSDDEAHDLAIELLEAGSLADIREIINAVDIAIAEADNGATETSENRAAI